ncbi:hypothetical protein LINPERHAP2_LOCUS42183 [Linum perenne]
MFSGDSDPCLWLEACVRYFRVSKVPTNEMVDEAGWYLENKAYFWFLDWENGRFPIPWDEFSQAISCRFGSSTPNTISASLPLKISTQVFDRNPHPSLTLSTSLASTPFIVGCTNTFLQFVDFIFPPQPTTYLNGNYPSRIEPYENVNPKVASSSFEALLLFCTPLIKGGGELVFNRGGCVIALFGRDVKKWRLLSACGLIDYDISCDVSVEVQGRCNFLSFKEPYKDADEINSWALKMKEVATMFMGLQMNASSKGFNESLEGSIASRTPILQCLIESGGTLVWSTRNCELLYPNYYGSTVSRLCVWKFISSLPNRIELQFRNQQAVRIVKEFQLLNLELGIFECMAALIWKGLKNRRWLSHDQNIYIPYYAAHIIGSYTMNMEEFAESSVHAGVIPPLIELLRGRLTWVEQRVAKWSPEKQRNGLAVLVLLRHCTP